MISLTLQGQRFQLRAAAVVVHDGHLLVHRAPGDSYWALPGGRVEIGEDAATTVVREMQEELGEQVHCGPLRHVAENFFDLAGQRFHEVGFYFQVALPTDSAYLDKNRTHAGVEQHLRLEFRWLPLADLAASNVRPTFLLRTLNADTAGCLHQVQREY